MKTVPWLTADDARQHLGLPTLGAFYTWKHRAKPRTYWLRGRMRFRQVDLDACVEVEQPRRASLRMVSSR